MKTRGMKKVFSLLVIFTLIFQQTGLAQIAGQLDMSKFMGQVNVFSGPQNFRPLHLRYFSYDTLTDNFQILLDKGNLKKLEGKQLKEQSQELLKYFLVGVTLPDAKFWVNLRPDSEDQIIDWELARTDLGKVLLEADLQLKKDLAQFTSPETAEGRWYWNKLYEKAGAIFGGQNITIPTLTRPWIVPGEVIIRENANSAYVYKATLKVMLEQDHLKNPRTQELANYTFSDPRLKELNDYSSQLIREKIIPKLTREVNASAKYAPLRQVFFSLILSRWFKGKFSGKSGMYPSLINTSNLNGLTSKEAWSKTPYFKEYQKSFNNGEYNIKEQASTVFGPTIRTYFSGGITLDPKPTASFTAGPGSGVTAALGQVGIGFQGRAGGKNLVEGFAPEEVPAAHEILKDIIKRAFDTSKVQDLLTHVQVGEFAKSALAGDDFIIALAQKIVNTKATEKTERLQRLVDEKLSEYEEANAAAKRKIIDELRTLLITQTRFKVLESGEDGVEDPYLYRTGDIRTQEHKAFVAHTGTFAYPESEKVPGGPRSIYMTLARVAGYMGLGDEGRLAFQELIKHEFGDLIAGEHVYEPLPRVLEAANLKIKQNYKKIARTRDLREYKTIGQQIYLDGVTWEQIESGEFEKLVREQGINGVTTNPPLIKKYLADKRVQEKAKQLSKELAGKGLSLGEVQKKVYRELIADLAEQVIQVFIRNGVKDATFSIEIDPTKADDIGASVKEAMEWLNIKNGQYRDYILVKVLANEKGCEVIRQVTALGGNVNATVLFSPEQYDKVIEAYIDGLEDADETGIDISKIRSVASFFVSRWDVKLAPDLSAEQQGKVGNAITTVAYHEIFKKWFTSERFTTLQALGGRAQQFLAASTGSKAKAIAQALKKKPEYKVKEKEVDELVAKAYPFDIYVSPLQGEGIINTLPYETIVDLMKNGFVPEATITQEANYTAAKQLLEDIKTKNKKDIEAVAAVLLKEGLQSFIDDYLDIQRTLAGIVGYSTLRDGVNNYAEANRVDAYSPLPGTPDLRQKTTELINREILKAQGLEISSADVTISLGTTGLLEHLTRIFCNIERGALKKLKQKDAVALSPHAKALYSPKTVFARITDLKAKSPKMMVIDSWDIEAVNLNKLLDQAVKDKTVVIFLDNDPTHQNIAQVYQLLNQNEQYRSNTMIVTDLSRRFGLPEYNVGSFVTFNKAIMAAYAAAVGGSIAAVSTEVQAGFAKLVAARLPEAVAPSQAGNKIAAIEDKDVLNRTFRDMAPDPTLSISPLIMLGQYKLSEILQASKNFPAFLLTLGDVFGSLEAAQLLDRFVRDKDTIPISTYESAFNKASSLGIVKRLLAAESKYVEELFSKYGSDHATFLSKLMDEFNPEISAILRDARLGPQALTPEEIVQLWIVFNIKKMHVGAPGFPRDDRGTAALQLPEERLTPEQIAQLDEQLLDAGVYFGKVFGLSFGRENVSAGYYGSKTVTQDIAIALELLYGREVTIARPQPDYIGNTSSLLGAGVPKEAMYMYPTKTSNSWVPTVAEIKQVIDQMNPNSIKLIRLTTPDNPSGTAIAQERIEEILELAVRNDAFLELDVAYARLLFKGKKPANLGEVCENIFRRLDPELKKRKGIRTASDVSKHFILIQTQSKEILQPGPREGTAISGNTELINKMREIKIFEADPVAKKAQVEIYGPNGVFYSEEYIQKHIQHLERNANYVCETLDRLGIHYVKPEGAFYILFRIGVGPYIRFSFAGSFTDIVEVMARIERSYPKWKEDKVDLSSVDLFKQVGITSVAGEIFGAPETKAEEDAIEKATTADVNVQAEPITWQDYAELEKLVRYHIVRSLYLAGSGHANTALSDVNMLLAAYAAGGMRYDSRDPKWDYRDRFVTKGHGYMSIYSVLAEMGFPVGDLDQVRSIDSDLSGHVTVKTPGIDANTGILGQSLSIALGMAINAKLEGTNYTTFCNIGDGETQEGQIYEAAEIASFLAPQGRMGKLVAMIDLNNAQRDGRPPDFGTVRIKEKWEAFGWEVLEVDGNDVFAVKKAIDQAKKTQDKPTVIICKTEKGRGVSFLSQGDSDWLRHGTPPKNAQEYFQALQELGVAVGVRQKKQVGDKTLEVEDQETALASFNMARIRRVAEEIQRKNQEYRDSLEAEEKANLHLQPTQWTWDEQQTVKYPTGSEKPTRQAAGEYFVELLDRNPQLRDRFVFLTMDLEESQCLKEVGEKYPQTRFRMGIREAATASIALGLSLASKGRIIPVVGTFGPFLPNMSPQLRIAMQTPGARMLVYMSHAAEALETGPDGPTHDAESFGPFATLALGLDTFVPADGNTMWDALNQVLNNVINNPASGVSIIAGARGVPNFSANVYGFKLEDPTVDSFLAWESKGIDEANKPDGIIVVPGPAMLNMAIQAAKKLDAEGRRVRVIYVQHFNAIIEKDSQFRQLIEPGVPIVTAQDGVREFLRGLVSGVLTSFDPDWGEIPRLDAIGIHGIPKTDGIAKGVSYREVRGQALAAYRLYGMDPDGIAETMRKMIDARRGPGTPASTDSKTPPPAGPSAAATASGTDVKPDGSASIPLGGIDFRAIPMITRPMGTLSGLSVSLPKLSNVESINLDEELRQIQKMLAAGITPSGERMKEYVAACYQKGELKTYVDGIVGCLVDICKLEEQKVAQTPKEVKELLLIMDSVG